MSKSDTPGLRTKIYVRNDMIGGGKVDLLRKVAETGSLELAARSIDMDMPRARFLIDTLQACFAHPLMQDDDTLTALGHELLDRYAQTEARLKDASAPLLDWLETQQPEP